MRRFVVSPDDTVAVWFSCGAASAVAAKIAVERYGDRCRVVNNPVIEEDEDNRRFLRDVEQWLGVTIETAINPEYPSCSAVDVWEKRKAMAFPKGAPCTIHLKKMARQAWENVNKPDFHVLGFTIDEIKRHERFVLTERDNVIPVLIEERLTKADCYMKIRQAGIDLPRIYKQGYPNANCIGCVEATGPEYWKLVKREHPDIFKDRAEQSRRLGVKLVRVHPRFLPWCSQDRLGRWHSDRGDALYKTDESGREKLVNPRIFLDELPENAEGRPLKNMDFECGIFCEEWSNDETA